MPTAEKVIKDIYLLPMKEREKVARHIIEFGIKITHHDLPEILNIKEWLSALTESRVYLVKSAS